MKRRELKKTINYLCGELYAECVALLQYHKVSSFADIENIMHSILMMQNDLVCRLSHVEPGSTKLFFKKIRQDMISRTNDIVEQLKNVA